jgi:hypothetical protein
MSEVDKSIQDLDETYHVEYERAVEEARRNAKQHVDKYFEHLIKIRAPAKVSKCVLSFSIPLVMSSETVKLTKSLFQKRLHNFFSMIYAILEPQKIRVDIMKNIFIFNRRHQRNMLEQEKERAERMERIRKVNNFMKSLLSEIPFSLFPIKILL